MSINHNEEVGVEPYPTEDLMREHGLLNRILLIYDYAVTFLSEHNAFCEELVSALSKSLHIVTKFIEEYHEPLEEKYIFAPLLDRGIETDLINELIKQHRISSLITKKIVLHLENKNAKKVIYYLKMFVFMYRAHESREDTIIFNKFRKLSTKGELERLGEEFERSEIKIFGKNGYEKLLEDVEQIEKGLYIHNLKSYTPDID